MKKRGWIGVLFVICCLALLTACGSDQTEKAQAAKKMDDVQKESAYPEADAVAKEAYQAILDTNKKMIFNLGTKELQSSLLLPNSPDPEFYSESIETIDASEDILPNNYSNSIKDDDYFLGVFNNVEREGILNYVLIIKPTEKLADANEWLTYSPDKEFQSFKIELVKEDGAWKLSQRRDWFSVKGSERDQFVQQVVDGQNKDVTVLHRGISFQQK